MNDVKIEDAGVCLKRITITITEDRVKEQIEQSFAAVSQDVSLPGFRPGRVPRRLIEKKFGDAVAQETKSQLFSSAYADAIEQNEIEVVGEPDTKTEIDSIDVMAGGDITLEVEVEVAPDFELPDVEGLKVMKPQIEIGDERVSEQVDRLCTNNGELEPREVAEVGDYCIGKGVMREKGAGDEADALLDLDGAVVQIPQDSDSGMILGIKVDDLAKQMGLPKQGDVLTVTAVGPEAHEIENVRGKDVQVTFTVDQVQRIVPAKAEDVAAQFGLGSEDQLRETIKLQLEQRVGVEQQAAMRQQVAKHLAENVDFELPERLTGAQAERSLERKRMELRTRGLDDQAIEQQVAELRHSSTELAQRELKLFFILARAAKKFEVSVTDEEMLGQIAQMAAQRGERPDKLRDQLVRSGQVQVLAQQIREHKVLDAILNQASIDDVSVEAYNEAFSKDDSVEAVGAGS